MRIGATLTSLSNEKLEEPGCWETQFSNSLPRASRRFRHLSKLTDVVDQSYSSIFVFACRNKARNICYSLPVGTDMACKSCGSESQSKFTAEMAIHLPGLKNIDQPPVWVFPELKVCTVCGNTEFVVPPAELRVLVKDDAA
jgi:hypothetical protein